MNGMVAGERRNALRVHAVDQRRPAAGHGHAPLVPDRKSQNFLEQSFRNHLIVISKRKLDGFIF